VSSFAHWFQAIAVLAVVALLLKRSIRGPRPWFARIAIVLSTGGFLALMAGNEPGDAATVVACLVILAGILTELVMACIDLHLVFRKFRQGRRG
jgi:hypothetical protein